jgi:hypothetical protein
MREPELDVDYYTSEEYICEYCYAAFEDEDSIITHVQEEHGDQLEDDEDAEKG